MTRILILLLMIASGARAIPPQEVPLESCRQLPLVKATVGDH
jgi:hypothetical protein